MEEAHTAFVNEDYANAVQLYTTYLATHPEDATALVSRAATYLRLDKNREALEDASKATTLSPELEVAHYRKGLAAFALEDFATAKQALERGQELVHGTEPAGRKYATWIRKCQVELEDTQKENEMPASSSSSTSAATPSASATASSAVPPSTPAVAPPSSTPAAAAAKYQYYQTPTHLTVTLLQKGVKEEEATVTIEPRRLKITHTQAGGPVVLFDKSPLFDAVVPEESTTKFFATKVEIKLKKATVGCQWDDLVGGASSSSNRISPVTLPTAAAPSASAPLTTATEGQAGKAPRPYASHKDWDKVEREIEKELESDKPQGEEALNKLFQDIYAKGDEETRRAMVKSFQTSGGTVLSTNWGEVAKKDYEADDERKPPQGMEWRKWN